MPGSTPENHQTASPASPSCSALLFRASMLFRVMVSFSRAVDKLSIRGTVPKWLRRFHHHMIDAILLRLGALQPNDLPTLSPVLSYGVLRIPDAYRTGTCTDQFLEPLMVFEQVDFREPLANPVLAMYLRIEGLPLLRCILIRLFSLSVYVERFSCRTRFIRIPPRGAIRQGSLTAGKGEIVGISRFFPGKGAYIRRVEGLAGGDG